MVVALLPAVAAPASDGLMKIDADTTLTEDHNGPIEIIADNVTLDCDGYKVLGSGEDRGITVNNRTGVTVLDCHVGGFVQGIGLANTQDSVIDSNTTTGNDAPGIVLFTSNDNTIKDNTSTYNGHYGIAMYQSKLLTVTGNEVSNNGVGGVEGLGMKIRETDSSTFSDNNASDNLTSGFFTDGTGNSFTNNDSHRNGELGFVDEATPGANTYSENRCIDNSDAGSTPTGLCSESGTFADDDESVFQFDIEWMAHEGITKGCNPPTNDRFCPDSNVTRGQMAAFLVRALDLPPAPSAGFTDTVGTTFEKDIDKLAAAGITKGCNPPDNDRFCPDDKVRREVMAAFLVRALGYTDDGGGDLFTDDDGSIFETDIDRLATAGVTKGCNPPTNDRFCPTQNVTRGQMAAFLRRALS